MNEATPLLSALQLPDELRRLSDEQLAQLSAEIRHEIVQVCSGGGLHLASSLGATDLIVALHSVLRSPTDRIVFDVGHQAYAHKILTGRREQMPTIKQQGGLSGFPKSSESPHDALTVGHASTSLAAALGMAMARDAQSQRHRIAAVIGDGALTGGMALAALNTIGDKAPNMLIVLNDNEMSISENVGGLNRFMRSLQVRRFVRDGEDTARKAISAISQPLADLVSRAKHSTRQFFDPASDNPFRAMGVRYVGPVDGHDIGEMRWLMRQLLELEGPTLLHVVTRKGKGLSYAEADPIAWHGPASFNISTGEARRSAAHTWSAAFGEAVTELATRDERIFTITPAMREGSGLVEYSRVHPDRYLDVGIAEDVAVTTAAGMALGGMRPVVAIYSTFLQRAYDQVLHDVALENLNVIFAVDRGGIVGADGATHNGVFDGSFLRSIPNVRVGWPKNAAEMRGMLNTALQAGGPFFIRYPRGNTEPATGEWPELPLGAWEREKEGDEAVILAAGKMLPVALQAAADLPNVGVINARWLKPLDEKMLLQVAKSARLIVTLEDNTVLGGFGSAVLERLAGVEGAPKVLTLGIPDQFQEHATPEEVHAELGLDEMGLKASLAAHGFLADRSVNGATLTQ